MAEEKTPSLSDVIELAVEARLLDLHVCLPGYVQKYDKAKNTVDVSIALKRVYEDESVVNYPVIVNVPVVFPRGGDFSMTFPIKTGDSVVLIFSERSLDIWKKNGGTVDPKDPRKFNLTDAIAIPGGYPQTKPVADASDVAVRIKNKNSLIEMTEDAKFKIQKIGGDDVIDLFSQTLQAIIDARIMTLMGPQQVLNVLTFQQLKTKIDALKGA